MTNYTIASRVLASRAIVAFEGEATSSVQKIMANVVTETSGERYNGENITFLLWLFNDDTFREELLHDWFYENMILAEKEDEEKDIKRTMRAVCKNALEGVRKGASNCPVILSKLTFNVFSHYLTTRKNKKGKYLSKGAYSGIRSALMHMYRMSGEEMNAGFRKDLGQFISGMKRVVTKAKLEEGASLDEGKKPMSFDVYKKMCDLLLRDGGEDAAFAHLFLILEWNLMARSENCVKMHVNHIQWREDALVFFFGKSKGNQSGENNHQPWHVYSNPLEPCICPVLSFAKYIFSHPDILKGDQLFPGTFQYDRFMKIFRKVIKDNLAAFEALGVEEGTLGSHSTRKGAITMVSTGCTVSPPMAAICLRACWSMGPVKDRYIHYEKAGDQFVGRTVTGISSLTKEFAVSPCYFELQDAPFGTKERIEDEIEENLVRKHELKPQLFAMLHFLYATICFHHDFLNECLHLRSSLRVSPMFIAASYLQTNKYAEVRFPWNKTENTPLFTGVPPHVAVLSEMEIMKKMMNEQTGTICESLRKEMDSRRVGGTEFAATQALEKFEAFASSMNESMQKWTNLTNMDRSKNAKEGVEHDHLGNDKLFSYRTQHNSWKRCALMTLRKATHLHSYRSRQ